MRGMTFEGERWRLATVGDWLPAGPHLPLTRSGGGAAIDLSRVV